MVILIIHTSIREANYYMEIISWALVGYGILKFAPVVSDVTGKVIDLVLK